MFLLARTKEFLSFLTLLIQWTRKVRNSLDGAGDFDDQRQEQEENGALFIDELEQFLTSY